MPNLRARTLARAAVLAGGVDVLAHRLGISLQTLRRYIHGDSAVPAEVFLRATVIIKHGVVAEPAKSAKPDEKPGKMS
jgi:predicted transcriptional regulator